MVYGGVVERDGRFGIVYERIEGRTFVRSMLTRSLRSISWDLADIHLKVHGAQVSGLQTTKEHLKGKIARAPTITQDEKSQLMERADSMSDGDRLCHGDVHPENVIYRTREEGGPVIIDWENASVGDPLADVGQTLLLTMFAWRGMPNLPARWMVRWTLGRIYRFYPRRYFERSGLDAVGVDRWMTVLAAARLDDRIPGEHDHLLRYVRERLAAAL
jgi:aminoglycoside phosphotransferase (APT) family kinase protein